MFYWWHKAFKARYYEKIPVFKELRSIDNARHIERKITDFCY